MTLLKCRECTGQVSSGAKVCPHCGTTKFRPTSKVTGAIAVFFALVLVVRICRGPQEENKIGDPVVEVSPPSPNRVYSEQVSDQSVANKQKETVSPAKTKKEKMLAKKKKREQDKKDNERFEECKEAMNLAINKGILHDIDWQPNRAPLVVAGPTFYRVDFETKKNVIAIVNCFFMSGRQLYMEFDVVDYRTGNSIGSFHWGRFRMDS